MLNLASFRMLATLCCISSPTFGHTEVLAAETANSAQWATPLAGDNSQYLQSLLDNSPMHPVELGCGTYTITKPIVVPAGGMLEAHSIWTYNIGNNAVPPCVTIAASRTVQTFTSDVAVVSLGDSSALRGVAILGTNSASGADGIKIMGSFVELFNDYVYEARVGVDCSGHIGLQMLHNLIGYNREDGVILLNNCGDATVGQNTIFSNGGYGVRAQSIGKTSFVQNTFEGNDAGGVLQYSSHELVWIGNFFADNNGPGVMFNNDSSNSNSATNFVGNSFRQNGMNVTDTDSSCQFYFAGPADQLVMIGNTYEALKGKPRYAFCANSRPNLSNSQILDTPAAQGEGVFRDVQTEIAVERARGRLGIVMNSTKRLTTVGDLPRCDMQTRYEIYEVRDAKAPVYGTGISGGGVSVALAICDGAKWISH